MGHVYVQLLNFKDKIVILVFDLASREFVYSLLQICQVIYQTNHFYVNIFILFILV